MRWVKPFISEEDSPPTGTCEFCGGPISADADSVYRHDATGYRRCNADDDSVFAQPSSWYEDEPVDL